MKPLLMNVLSIGVLGLPAGAGFAQSAAPQMCGWAQPDSFKFCECGSQQWG